MRVLAPGRGAAALRHQGAEVRVRDHVDPGRGCHLGGRCRDDVLARIGAETTQAVGGVACARRLFANAGAADRPGRRREYSGTYRNALLDLLRECPIGVGNDDSCHALQQDAIAVIELCVVQDELAAGLFETVCAGLRGDGRADLGGQRQFVRAAGCAEYRQFAADAVRVPVRLGLNQLPREIESDRVGQSQQH